MQFDKITSKENSLVKYIAKLQTSSGFRKECNRCVLEGLRIIDDAVNNNVKFEYLCFSETAFNKQTKIIEALALNAEKSIMFSDLLFNKLCDTKTPQGLIAVADLSSLKPLIVAENGSYIALENLQDPANLGAIARTAEALGINGIIMTENCCDFVAPKALRASMGTLLRLPVLIVPSIKVFLDNNKCNSYACVLKGATEKVGEFAFRKSAVAVIGNEANGLSDETVNACQHRITIPMNGNVESLNAALAASIVMWEMCKC